MLTTKSRPRPKTKRPSPIPTTPKDARTTPPKYAWLGATDLSTEPAQASGTITQGGAAYVPQIADDLQTAPVVPPGAFPNGQGTGSAFVDFFFSLKDFAEETLEGIFTGDASAKWDEALAGGLEECVSSSTSGGASRLTAAASSKLLRSVSAGGKTCALGKCVGLPELVLPDLNKTPNIYECEWVTEGPKRFLSDCI